MKRLISALILATTIGAGSVFVNAASARTANSMQVAQIVFGDRHHRRHNRDRNGRTRYETRTVYKGRKVYEDTYKITYKNGHEKMKRVEHRRVA